jgi:putative nucleotidyltransferase with HDIG domain
VVLAAGLSQRMGRFKPLLPLGASRAIERVVSFFQTAGVGDILVVTGHRAADVRQAVEPFDARCVENPDYRQGMFSSVLAGIRALPEQCRGFFVHPADIPLVRTQTVVRLMAALEETEAAIVYPAFDGRRGHPTLIRSRLGAKVPGGSDAGGLRAFLQRHETESFNLPVADEAVLWDLDTPWDYRRMLDRQRHAGLPTKQECRVLMEEIQALPASIAAHCRAVAVVAQRIARALLTAGASIDFELVRTAALLHDIARTRKKSHADIGADLLEYHGFPRLAPLVRAHMDLEMDEDPSMDEIQTVYLADKLVLGDRRVDLEQRFARQIEKFGARPSVLAAILQRRENARHIQAKVERITDRPIHTITGPPGPLKGAYEDVQGEDDA